MENIKITDPRSFITEKVSSARSTEKKAPNTGSKTRRKLAVIILTFFCPKSSRKYARRVGKSIIRNNSFEYVCKLVKLRGTWKIRIRTKLIIDIVKNC